MSTKTPAKPRATRAKKAPAKPPAEADTKKTDEPVKKSRSSVVTPQVVAKITEAVKKAGPEGITLSELTTATGLNYRQVHNATWRMEGSPKDGALKKPEERVLSRINTDRKVRYVMREAGTAAPIMRGHYATRGPVEDGES